MIQEILVALSGHPSTLFVDRDTPDNDASLVNPDLTDLASSEKALLQGVGQTALYHRLLKKHLHAVLSSHGSLVCRAVAASLLHTHLRRFHDHILAIENRILTKDTDLVGAYRNVPLSALVTEIDPWQRLLRWFWSLMILIDPTISHDTAQHGHKPADATILMNHLRQEAQTGFEDVEAVAIELSAVAERTWLRLMSTWVLHGKLPEHGANDLFIDTKSTTDGSGHAEFSAESRRIPAFVEHRTAASLLFIGKTLSQLHTYQEFTHPSRSSQTDSKDLLQVHTSILGSLDFPLSSNALSRAVSQIRKSLSQNVLQLLLPVEEINFTLDVIRQFLLLERGEFAILVIEEADRATQSKNKLLTEHTSDLVSSLRNLSINDGDLLEVTNKAWRSLINLSKSGEDDDYLDRARALVRLELVPPNKRDPYQKLQVDSNDSCSKFYDVLFPAIKAQLVMTIPRPLDLFLSPTDVAHYSSINSYLISLHKTRLSLSSLWRPSATRRHSLSTPLSRKTWATCSAALLLLSEFTAYLEALISQAWARFRAWATAHARDPESLAAAHRALLAALVHALLLADDALTTDLRALMALVDALQRLFARHLALPEAGIELDRARKRVDAGLRAVVRRLRALDGERAESARYGGEEQGGDAGEALDLPRDGWLPAGTGLHRLLMKLDFARGDDEGGEVEEEGRV